MATFTANSIQLATGAQFVGTTNGLSDAPAGSIIQTAINGTTSRITANSDGSFTDLLSLSFTPRQSNSKIIFSIMFNAYYNNNNGYSQGVSYRFLRDSTSIKEGDWTFYLHNNQYARDFYPTVSTFGFDEPGGTSAITYKLQGRKYNGNSDRFATQFGEAQRSSVIGDTIVIKLEELSV
jgi:hypothetical protein|tara:strand:- start:45 stop:581 length:537 start_codon:yes stop_codon:yes gene_type:complete